MQQTVPKINYSTQDKMSLYRLHGIDEDICVIQTVLFFKAYDK